MTLREALGLEIRAAAEDQELTISKLATATGIHRVSLHRYLDGSRALPIDTIERIAGALHLRPSELIARAEQRMGRP